MDIQSLIVFCMEVAGTIAFAASGAMVGIRRGMDIWNLCIGSCDIGWRWDDKGYYPWQCARRIDRPYLCCRCTVYHAYGLLGILF